MFAKTIVFLVLMELFYRSSIFHEVGQISSMVDTDANQIYPGEFAYLAPSAPEKAPILMVKLQLMLMILKGPRAV